MDFSSQQPDETGFQVAPLIDVVFILLIFFLATYVVAQDERQLDIVLPEASAAQDTARSLRDVVVNIGPGGAITVNQRAMTRILLEQRLAQLMRFAEDLRARGDTSAEPGVIIRAHAECPHKHVVGILDMCERLKIRRVFFSTLPGGSESHAQP